MDNEILKGINNSNLLIKARSGSHLIRMDNSKSLRLNPFYNDYIQARVCIENEWNQEYYIIYNSYILEDKDS